MIFLEQSRLEWPSTSFFFLLFSGISRGNKKGICLLWCYFRTSRLTQWRKWGPFLTVVVQRRGQPHWKEELTKQNTRDSIVYYTLCTSLPLPWSSSAWKKLLLKSEKGLCIQGICIINRHFRCAFFFFCLRKKFVLENAANLANGLLKVSLRVGRHIWRDNSLHILLLSLGLFTFQLLGSHVQIEYTSLIQQAFFFLSLPPS